MPAVVVRQRKSWRRKNGVYLYFEGWLWWNGVRAFPSSRRQWTYLQQLEINLHRPKPTSSRQSVETSTSTSDRNHVQVLGTSVISTVDHSTSGKTKSHSELVSSSTSTSYIVKTHLTNHTTLSSSHSDKRSIWTTRKLKSTIPLLFINNRSYRISLNNDFSAIGTNIDRRT